MKIVLVLNKPNREMVVMESIKREILSLNPASQVRIVHSDNPDFDSIVFGFNPTAILTFPFTGVGLAQRYYVYKLFLNCKLILLRAEGVINTQKRAEVAYAVGYDKYGKYLVDYEIFWGKRTAKVLGAELLRQSKISSITRVKCIGYPEIEFFFKNSDSDSRVGLSHRIADKLANYPKERVVLFVTGFHLANYTRERFMAAKDVDMETNGDLFMVGVERAKAFRREWIENVLSTAFKNPKFLFVLKKHPIERKEDYSLLEGVHNILYIHEDVKIQPIIPYAGLFFHYGSTTVVNAYLSGVPSVFVYSEKVIPTFMDTLCPESLKVSPSGMSQVVADYRSGKIRFEFKESMGTVLKDFFNIEIGSPYCPSREIASLLLDSNPAQKIPLSDRYLWRALFLSAYRMGLRTIGSFVKRVIGMPQEQTFFSRKT